MSTNKTAFPDGFPFSDFMEGNFSSSSIFWEEHILQLIVSRIKRKEVMSRVRNYSGITNYRRKFIPKEFLANMSHQSDGNPVYLSNIPTISRSIRIIQEDITKGLQIGAWIEPQSEFKEFPELVISLEPTNIEFHIAEELILLWLSNIIEERTVERYINIRIGN